MKDSDVMRALEFAKIIERKEAYSDLNKEERRFLLLLVQQFRIPDADALSRFTVQTLKPLMGKLTKE